MSSNPAVSIFAEIQLRRGKLEEQAKDELKSLKSVFAGNSLASIPLTFDIPPDLAQKLQIKLSALKFSPINVPVNFVSSGMPGMNGGGMDGASSPNWSYLLRGQGGGSAAPSRSPKYDQDSLDFERFQAQGAIQRQQDDRDFQRFIAGRKGDGSGTSGGAGGRSNLYNPFSARGLVRNLGMGAAGVYGGLMAVHAATGMAEAYQESSHPERVMREFDHLGGRHDVQGDSFMQQQAGQLAGIAGEKKVMETINSVPLIGSLTSFISAINGSAKALEDQSFSARRLIEIHQGTMKQRDQNELETAELTHDPIAIRAAKRRAEEQESTKGIQDAADEVDRIQAARDAAGDRDFANIENDPHKATALQLRSARQELVNRKKAAEVRRTNSDKKDSEVNLDREVIRTRATAEADKSDKLALAAGMERNGSPLDSTLKKNQAEMDSFDAKLKAKLNDPTRDKKMDDVVRKQGASDRAALNARQSLGYDRERQEEDLTVKRYGNESSTIDLRMSGKTDAAERKALKDKQDEKLARLNGPGGNKEEGQAYALTAEKESAELEQKITLSRTKEAGDAAAKLTEISSSADEKMLAAEGHTADALLQSTKRTGDARVAALQREAASTKDTQRSTELLAEARATEAANAKNLAAISKEQSRMAALDLKKSGEALGSAKMEFAGNRYGASQKTIADAYQQKVDAIRLKGGDGMKDDLASAANERDESTLKLKAQRIASNASMAIEGQDAMARSHGQEGVGGVLSFQEELRKKYQDAGTDKDQIKNVDNYKLAEMAAKRRELRPHDAGMRYGGAEYHDVLQSQINSGYGHGEAMKKLMEVGKMNAGNAGTPEQAQQKVTKELSDAVKKFDTAIDKMNKRKAV